MKDVNWRKVFIVPVMLGKVIKTAMGRGFKAMAIYIIA